MDYLTEAIQRMHLVARDHDRDRPNPDLRYQWTNEAIAYALMAIAASLVRAEQKQADCQPLTCANCGTTPHGMAREAWVQATGNGLLCPRCAHTATHNPQTAL